MSQFLSLAEARYSVRSFTQEAVSDADIAAILHAAKVAPTAANRQPQKIFVLKSAEALEKLKACTNSHFNAPLAFIISYAKDECWCRPFDKKLSGDIDASIITTHMMLAAADLGLGSTWVMFYDPEALKAQFELPENWESTAILVVGHPSPEAKPAPGHTSFRDESEIVTVL